jgi:hypothetical protein
MTMRGSLCACALLLFGGSPGAHAELFGDETKCSAVTALMERQPPDKQIQQEALKYIVASMRALDRAYALKGKAEILLQMTDEGRNSIALLAATRCKSRGDLPVADVAVDTYQSVRAMQGSLGFNEKPKPKQSGLAAPRRKSVARVSRPTPIRRAPARRGATLRYVR